MHPTRFWTDLARGPALRRHAWAIAELSSETGLDELCVELEVITGEPALSLRGSLLVVCANKTSTLVSPTSVIEQLAVDDARLCLWVMTRLLQDVVIANNRAGENIPYPKKFLKKLDYLASLCRGDGNHGKLPALRSALEGFTYISRDVFARDVALAAIESSYLTIARLPREDRDSGIIAARRLFLTREIYFTAPATTLIQRAIMEFPVATTPWSSK